MAPAWMPGKGLAAGMLYWPVARILKFCEGHTAQKARKQGVRGTRSPRKKNKGLAAAKNFSPRQRLRNQRFQSRQQIK